MKEEEIYQLVCDYHFSELTAAQQSQIKGTMGMEEYTALRHMHLASLQLQNRTAPDIDSNLQSLNLLKEQMRHRNGIAWFQLRVPMWQAAASALLLAALVWIFLWPAKEPPAILQVRADTIYIRSKQETPALAGEHKKEITSVQPAFKPQQNVKSGKTKPGVKHENAVQADQVTSLAEHKAVAVSHGRSMKDNPWLTRFSFSTP
ncbi:MAG: hypothetical protein JNL57_02895 [Bacteroidetes bacterium]|nr:hypothetical protein [Bacteroidota bacterium]